MIATNAAHVAAAILAFVIGWGRAEVPEMVIHTLLVHVEGVDPALLDATIDHLLDAGYLIPRIAEAPALSVTPEGRRAMIG